MTSTARLLRRFAEDRGGAALIDFAFAVPILIVVLIGCFEATRYVLLRQKLDRAVAATADLVAQQENITLAQLTDLFDAAEQLLDPYDLATDGRVIVSQVYWPDPDDPAEVEWQEQSPTGIMVSSRIGVENGEATLPDGFTVRTDEAVIVAEVFYDYEPFFLANLFEARRLYHSAYNRPRN